MGSLALLAKEAGYKVSGCDLGVYPPMSTQLEEAGIELIDGFSEQQVALKPDLWVIGNVVSRGNELMEAILNSGLPYTSGPQWLADHVLQGRWVLAVAGTHGKTTTSSMLAWILEYAGFEPGFLIGGVPENFGLSARLGKSDFFVIEADEYDTAFFDKRSKFVHYRPQTLILNNLEFDHADIFDSLKDIQKQFHHLVRTVSGQGLLISPKADKALNDVLAMGAWTQCQHSGMAEACEENAAAQHLSEPTAWQYRLLDKVSNSAEILFEGQSVASLTWHLSGEHNLQNALHAVAAARHIGIAPALACEALSSFKNVKRRMQLLAEVGGCRVYDDFAHHPTAIKFTLEGLRRKVGGESILAVIEPRSNTMKLGVHAEALGEASQEADDCFWFDDASMPWSLADKVSREDGSAVIFSEHDVLIDACLTKAAKGQPLHIVVMSNGGFAGVPRRIADAITEAMQLSENIKGCGNE